MRARLSDRISSAKSSNEAIASEVQSEMLRSHPSLQNFGWRSHPFFTKDSYFSLELENLGEPFGKDDRTLKLEILLAIAWSTIFLSDSFLSIHILYYCKH